MTRRARFLPLAAITVAFAAGDGRVARADPSSATGVLGDSTGGVDAPLAGGLSMVSDLASTNLGTGAARSSIPFALPAARGAVQPRLSLSYDSSSGVREAGLGWGLSLPSIERRPLSNKPTYTTSDRFVYGGAPLVPICTIGGSDCPADPKGVTTTYPAWATGWTYFRLQIDDLHGRFFLSPDQSTWRVQLPSGELMELGVPRDAPGDLQAVDSDFPPPTPLQPTPPALGVYRWNLRYDSDANGNRVDYRWTHGSRLGLGYLSDVFDTALGSSFAHHVHLKWLPLPPPTPAQPPVWRAHPEQMLVGVDVTSATFLEGTARELVRRYHLDYDTSPTVNLLAQPAYPHLQAIRTEGRCEAPIFEKDDGSLADTACSFLPTVSFGYTPSHLGTTLAPKKLAAAGLTLSPLTPWNGPSFVFVDLDGNGAVDVLQPPHDAVTTETIWINEPGRSLQPFVGASVGPAGTGASLAALFGPPSATNGVAMMGDFTGCGRTSALWSNGSDSWVYDWQRPTSGQWTWTGRVLHDSKGKPAIVPAGATDPEARAIAVGDIDGDGYVDRLRAEAGKPSKSNGEELLHVELTTRTETGGPSGGVATVSPFAKDGGTERAYWTTVVGSNVKWWPLAHELVDIDGDGLADLVEIATDQPVVVNAQNVRIAYSRGDGTGQFIAQRDVYDPTNGLLKNPIVAATFHVPAAAATWTAGEILFGDLTGDGLAEMVVNTFASIDVYTYQPTTQSYQPYATLPTNANSGAFWVGHGSVSLADINGSGHSDIVFTSYATGSNGKDNDGVWYVDLVGEDPATGMPYVPAGLLSHIDYGVNLHVDIAYETTATAPEAPGWSTQSPQVMPIVASITRTNGVASATTGGGMSTIEDQYTYDRPEYDGWARRFLGFHTVQVHHSGTAGAATTRGSFTRTTFFYDDPFDSLGESCADAVVRGVHPITEVIQGAPVLEERWSADDGTYGQYLYTRHTAYGRQVVGLFGNSLVHFAWPEQVDTYLYDTASYVAQGTTVTLPDLFNVGDGTVAASGTYSLPSTSYAHLKQVSIVDVNGNEQSSQDFGQVDATGASKDGVITRMRVWQRPTGEATGWLFRVSHETVSGDAGGTRDRTFAYDALGNLREIDASLTGTQPLVRTHEDPSQPVAPAPANASQDNPKLMQAKYTYDAFGNVLTSEGPNGRCTAITYDPQFSELAVSTTAYTAGCGGGAALTSIVAYDRGLGVVTASNTPNGALTMTSYDAFGRVSSTTLPDSLGVQSANSATVTYEYLPPAAGTPEKVHVTTAGPGIATAESWSYFDAFGEPLVTLRTADTTHGDPQAWIASGRTLRDYQGNPVQSYRAAPYGGDPRAYPVSGALTGPHTSTTWDAFGRPLNGTNYEGAKEWAIAYHALSVDTFDGFALSTSPPSAGATKTTDGHGRTRLVTRHARDGSDHVSIATTYLATGEPSQIVQSHTAGTDTVTRWMDYDSLGRMVSNFEPNTGSASSLPGGMKSWRYAYDDAGDLVGTSDARGCGENMTYDGLGRLVAEDYSPCLKAQASWSSTPEAVYTYDAGEAGMPVTPGTSRLGHLIAVQDRGAHSRFAYDARGSVVSAQRAVAIPIDERPASPIADPGNVGAAIYASHWFTKGVSYDALGRVHEEGTGADVAELQNPSALSLSSVTMLYGPRGNVTGIQSSYGDLLTSRVLDLDGLLSQETYGDRAQTTLSMAYDAERRLQEYKIARTAPSIWSSPPAGYSTPPLGSRPTVLADLVYTYQSPSADMVIGIADARPASEWPDGAAPMSRTFWYDPFDRLQSVQYGYSGTSTQLPETTSSDAAPVPTTTMPQRVASQSFVFDWKGNMTKSADDQYVFYDRSLGTITNGTAHPNQLVSATGYVHCPPKLPNCQQPGLQAAYDAAGNLTSLLVSRRQACTAPDGRCSSRFVYDWDEVGQLVRARRWDYANVKSDTYPAVPSSAPDVDLTYAYSQGARVLKTARDSEGSGANARSALEVFSTLRLNHATYDPTTNTYERTAATETAYLAGGLARVVYAQTDVPSLTSGKLHVFFELGDTLGSTAAVIDRDTSELVEASTYQAYGAPETDYAPDRWGDFREEYRFSGKEDDREVGLTYFGARYYAPALGRWISPDPLAIHGLGADPNVYAYVGGSPHVLTDAIGLNDDGSDGCLGSEKVCNGNGDGGGNGDGDGSGDGDGGWGPVGVMNPSGPTLGPRGGSHHYVGTPPPPPPPPPPPRVTANPAVTLAWVMNSAQNFNAGTAGQNWSGDVTGFHGAMQKLALPLALSGWLAAAQLSVIALPDLAAAGGQAYTAAEQAYVNASTALWARYPALAGVASVGGKLAAGFNGNSFELGTAESAAASTCPCFSGDTLVPTAEGERPIRDLHAGDLVVSRDESTGDVALRPVRQVFVTPHKEVIGVVVEHEDGSEETIHATPNHPFRVVGKGWVGAASLTGGDELITSTGAHARVKGSFSASGDETVYNLEVDGFHTYFVGETGVWVHNACPCVNPPNDHHILPQAFRDWFAGGGRGIDIDQYLVSVPENVHLDILHGKVLETSAGTLRFNGGGIWNANWARFISENPTATRDEVLNFARAMCRGFGLRCGI